MNFDRTRSGQSAGAHHPIPGSPAAATLIGVLTVTASVLAYAATAGVACVLVLGWRGRKAIKPPFFGTTPPGTAAGTETGAPIDMILYCPACGSQHIDEPDERSPGWANPPHRSHLCHNPTCGCVWRPADVATNGVSTLTTAGNTDTWAGQRGAPAKIG